VSGVEILNFLKKSLGIITKRLEEGGVLSTPSFKDHTFIPELEVDDRGLSLPINGLVYKVKVVGDYPAYINVDRAVTDYEYVPVFPGEYYVIPRRGNVLYVKAPAGFRTKVRIEALA